MRIIAHCQMEDTATDPNKLCMQTRKQSRMHIKPLKHVQFTLIKMKESVWIASVFINLIIILLIVDRSEGDPRSQILKLTCDSQSENNQTIFIPNFVRSMEKIGTQMRTSRSGTALTGTGPDSVYGLAECYGDLSSEDCILCYAEARTLLPRCFPQNGGQIFLDGCFMRIQNYSFYEEYAGPHETVICGNTTRSSVFHDSVRRVVSNALRDAPRNGNYFARSPLTLSVNESTYVLADCWKTLNESSCTKCLERASASILQCLPSSEGRALHTGCFMRYSDTDFLNQGNNGVGNAKSQVIQLICGNQQANNQTKFIPNFFRTMEDINIKMRTSHTGTAVVGTEPDSNYGLSQCYGDLSTSECNLCYAEARSTLPSCLPKNGGRVYLNSCFMRFENYSFFGDHTGPEDRIICGNKTQKNSAFEQSASKAVFQAVESAPKSKNYHAGAQALISGTENKSTYAVADCWSTLDADSCGWCLQKAARSMLGCLPGPEGYALYTGCFIRYSDTNFLDPDHKRLSKGKIVVIITLVGSGIACAVGIIIPFYVWMRRNKSKRRKGSSNDTKLSKILNNSSLNFKYSAIEKATNSFDEAKKLGQGGFGTVYKGALPNGREIAVKRLFFNHRHRATDFYNEVNIISSVDHKNLVKLVGFSCSGPESILIYEYLPNRSLDHFIFDACRGKELNWAKRFDIIIGTAEGLAHLHENSKTRIIHRDIKAANILLDSRLHAKIADFGLARSFQEDKNHISTGIAGTLGYMAPEYVGHGQLTEKVDVYSFGVLLLEIVTGMPNRGMKTSESEYTHSLVSIAWKHFKEGSIEEIFDPNLMLHDYTNNNNLKKEIQNVIHIALLCAQEVPSLRPTMSMALQMLSKNIQPLPSPSNPAFIPKTNIQFNEFDSNQDLRFRVNDPASVGTVSHSSFNPR